jgi:hypothetical protein
MNLPGSVRLEKQKHKDVCPQCGDWQKLVAICDGNSGELLAERCDICFVALWRGEG